MNSPLLVAVTVASIAGAPAHIDAQGRTAQPRPGVDHSGPGHVVGVQPVAVTRAPTVFVNGYYYPALYRPAWYSNIGFGVSFGYPYGPYPYYGWPYYAAPYGAWPYYYGPTVYDVSGSVRLQVTPREAEVFVDGYYAGTVDDFDGTFQRLHVDPGEHELQVYLAGHRPIQQRVYLQPGKTFTIKQTMEPLAPGETAPPPPTPASIPGPPRSRERVDRDAVTVDDSRAGRSTPVAAAAGFGSLAVRVQPLDAEVLIDGEPWHGSLDSGSVVVQLGAGMHHIEIRREGYRSYFTDVTLESGKSKTLNVALTKQ